MSENEQVAINEPVEVDQSAANASTGNALTPSSKLYVGNLSWNINQDILKEIFSKFGNVTDAYVSIDRDTGRSKGFGFITFSEMSEAEKAREALNGSELEGRHIKIDFAQVKERPPRDSSGI